MTDYGTNGGDSLITSNGGATTNAIAFGGGAGGNGPLSGQTATVNGRDGGSGGGATRFDAVVGAGTDGQGSAGGVGLYGSQSDSRQESGGGGGAGGTGSAGSRGGTQFPGAGGSGVRIDITGTPTYYAGGGSGGGEAFVNGDNRGYPLSGGLGGGGRGGMKSDIAGDEVPTAGEDGLGGGGGGGSTVQGYTSGGAGGSGVVVVRYPATGTGAGATEPTVSLTGLDYDSANNVATLSYRVAWAGSGYQRADVAAVWGFSEDALTTEVTLDTDVIGCGTGTITGLPSVSRTVYVKVKATNAGNASGVSTETETIALHNPRAPEATLENTAVAVDGGTFTVDVTSLGQGASSAVVSLQSCAYRAFASGVVTNADLAALAATGAVSVAATGLTDSSTWWVRAVVTNDIGEVYESDPLSITTLSPGYPACSGKISDIGYTSVSASTRATVVGLGSTETTRWLEVSESADFSTLLGTSTLITSAAINSDGTLTLTGLSPETAYHARLAISNTWNRTAYVLLSDFTTRSEPFAASGPAWTAGDGTFDFSLDVAAVYDGATCEATLTYGGDEIGTQNFTAAGTVSWNGVTAAADGAVAQIVVVATLPNDGGTFTKTFSAPVAAGSSGRTVKNIAGYASAAGAYWMRPGDSVALPTAVGDGFYQVLNERFARLEGSSLVALEPGIVGVRCVDATHVTNIMGVVILPDAIGEGAVYVYDETKFSEDSWTKAVSWKKVDGATRSAAASNDSWPCQADDIAILPFYNRAGDMYIRHRDHIALGGLYAGMIRPDASVNCHLERFKEVTTKTVTFRRTDGQPVDVKTCPNSEGGNYSRIVLAGYDIDVVWASDAIIDGCSSETDVNGPRGRFYVKTGGSTNTLQNVTLTFQGYPGYWVNGNGCTDTLKGVWKGSGTIVKKGMGGIAFDGDFSGFSGTIRETSAPNLGGIGAPAAGLLLRAPGASNVTAHVYGCIAPNPTYRTPNINGAGHGFLGTGGYGIAPTTSQSPGKGLYMHGGTYCANDIPNTTWGVGVRDDKVLDVLSAGAGFSFIQMRTQDNSKGNPINAITAKTLVQTDRGTLGVYDPSHDAAPATAKTNSLFYALDRTGAETGAQGNPVTDVSYPIVPWMVAPHDGNWSQLYFASFDAAGRLVRPGASANFQIDEAPAPTANLRSWDRDLNHGSATDITVQSLFVSNSGKNRWLGADRTLTITSGGLVLHGNNTAIGLPGRDDNGALVLGDASHPAYVWARSYPAETNRIWAAVTAPGGFVSAYTGNLELGGDQTGIAGEIVVNGGTLALGSADYGIRLKAGLPVRVCAGASLLLPQHSAIARNPLRIDGSGGAFGKVVLSGNSPCASLEVRDVFESTEWTTLPNGTYGATGSGAEFVRDDLFAGTGVLAVGAWTDGTVIMIR